MAEEFSLLNNGATINVQLVSRDEEEVRQQAIAMVQAAVSPEALEDEAALRKAMEVLERSKEAVAKWDAMLHEKQTDMNSSVLVGSKNGEDSAGKAEPPLPGRMTDAGNGASNSVLHPSLSLDALHFRRRTALREVKTKEEELFRLQTQVRSRQAQRLRQAQVDETAREERERAKAAHLRAEFASRQANRQAALGSTGERTAKSTPTPESFSLKRRIPIRPLREAVFGHRAEPPQTNGFSSLSNASSSEMLTSRPSLPLPHGHLVSSREYRGGTLLPRIHRVQLRSTKRVRYEDDTNAEAFQARIAKREKLEELQYAQQLEAEAVRSRTSSSSSLPQTKMEEVDDVPSVKEVRSPAAMNIIDVDALMEVEDDVLEKALESHPNEMGRRSERKGSMNREVKGGQAVESVEKATFSPKGEFSTSVSQQSFPISPPLTLLPILGNLVIPATVYHRLLDFQQEGVQWLLGLHLRRHGGILGDEMGLGKTVQIAAMLCSLSHSHQLHGPVLLVCPVTVLRQWVAELHRWTPRTRVVVLHQLSTTAASPLSPKAVIETIRGQANTVLLTSYASMRRHCEVLQSAGFHYVILDEGHKISNPAAGTTMAAKAFATPHRLLLTGSPIQNSLKELWCLFDFVRPGLLGTLSGFVTEFEEVIGRSKHARASPLVLSEAVEAAKVLQERIVTSLLRRLKRHVNAALPEKYEKVIYVTLTDVQLQEYVTFLASAEIQTLMAQASSYQILSGGLNRDYRDSSGSLHVAGRSFYMKDRSRTSQIRLESFRALHRLRQLCNHVDIFRRQNQQESSDDSEEAVEESPEDTSEFRDFSRTALGMSGKKKKKSNSRFSPSISTSERNKKSGRVGALHVGRSYASNYPADLRGSAKLQTLQLMLKEWKQGSHRALVFSQTRMMLDIIENMVESDGHCYVRMDGTTPIRQRQDLMDRFNADENVFLALLTTRVGGVGLNLIGADRVVIFDPDWNPTTDSQARERSWRVGQWRDVCVYRLITMGTVEEFIFQRQLAKMYVTDKVLRDPSYQRFFTQESFVEGLLLGKCYDGRVPEGQKHVLLCRDLSLHTENSSSAADPTQNDHKSVSSPGTEEDNGLLVRSSTTDGRSLEDVRGREVVVQYEEYNADSVQANSSLPSSPSSPDLSRGVSSPTSGEEGLSVLKNLVDGASVHDAPHDVAKRLAKIRAHQRMQRVSALGDQRRLTDQQEDFKQFLQSNPMKEEDHDPEE